MKHVQLFSVVLVALLSVPLAHAQTSYPMVMGLNPLAARIGQTTEHEVVSRYNLYGAYQVLVTGSGVTGEVAAPETPKPEAKPAEVAAADKDKEKEKGKENEKEQEKKPAEAAPPKKPNLEKLKLRFTVAADAVPGVRDFRLITPQGPSTLGQVVLVRDPVVEEKGNNDTLEKAQSVSLPATVCGIIEKAEDVDFFKFKIDAPTGLTFHVQSMRCENKIHDLQAHSDPILTLRNETGTVLAMNDNYFFGDPLLHYQFTTPGEYAIEIRDVRYQGNNYWQYSIEINSRPFVTNAHPFRVTPGTPTTVGLVGFNLPANPTVPLTMPADAAEGPQWVSLTLGDVVTSAIPVVVSKLPDAVEADSPNNGPEQAQALAVPVGVSGRIEAPADLDYYAFEAKKGDRLSFEVLARRHKSALDPLLRIINDKAARLVENDDAGTGRHEYPDSLIENWTAPADGKYFLEISDLNLQGGPEFVYFLKITPSEPYFVLEVDTDKSVLSPGLAAPLFVRVVRRNGFTGPVQLAVEGLPPGVTASCGQILDGANDGNIILQAAADAPPGAANFRITGSAKFTRDGREWDLIATARPLQEIYFPGGGRGHWPVEMQTAAVGDVLDLRSLKVGPTEITLTPGASQKIDITIERSEGFDKNVTLDVLFRHLGSMFGNCLPPGVTIDEKNSKTLLTGKESQGHITLTASDKAQPVEKQQIAVMAHISLNFVMKMTYCGEPVFVTVPKP